VLVHFFATWCEPCREELAALRRLAARAEPNSMAVLAISVAEIDLRVRRFLETIPVTFPVLLDRDRAIAKAWKISTLPSTVILDSNLKPRLVVETDFAWDQIEPGALIGRINSARTSQIAQSHQEKK
jgi:thiol-disulfide isomerase/thioredoxin